MRCELERGPGLCLSLVLLFPRLPVLPPPIANVALARNVGYVVDDQPFALFVVVSADVWFSSNRQPTAVVLQLCRGPQASQQLSSGLWS